MKEQSENLAINLRFLCQLQGSISAAAAGMNINRQQINKYLNGTSTPSLATLSKICNYFSVDEAEIFCDPDELRDIVLSRKKAHALPSDVSAAIEQIHELALEASPLVSDLVGKYYFYSIARNPALINRAYCSIDEKEGHLFASHIECYSMPGEEEEGRRRVVHRFNSLILPVGGRILMLTVENLETQQTVISSALFYPTNFPQLATIEGKAVTVSSFGSRPIYYSPVAMEFIGKGSIERKQLKSLGFFEIDEPTIRPQIRKFLVENYLDQW